MPSTFHRGVWPFSTSPSLDRASTEIAKEDDDLLHVSNDDLVNTGATAWLSVKKDSTVKFFLKTSPRT